MNISTLRSARLCVSGALLLCQLNQPWASDLPAITLRDGMVTTQVVEYHAASPDLVIRLEHVGTDGAHWKVESQLAKADEARHSSGYGSGAFDSAEDLKSSHRLFLRFFAGENEPQVGATTLMLSSDAFDELRAKGETDIDVIEIPPDAGDVYDPDKVATRKNFRGKMTRVGIEPMRIIVNGVPQQIPALHAKGTLKARDLVHTFEFWWIDNPAVRLMLRYRFENYTERRMVRIDFPQDQPNGATPMTAALEKSCRAELSGVYFASGSADLLAASRATLEQIAATLKKHPDWTITIEGHTDNVGSEAANLALSRDRAAAVRDALTSQYGVPSARVKTEAFGRKRPVDSNDTVEGRAHNRRVEVSRTC